MAKKIFIHRKDGKEYEYSVRENRDRVFTPHEWKRFIDNLNVRQRFTFNILMLTGARIMEVQHVKPEHIDYKNQRLTLVRTKQRANKRGEKKSKTRTIRISRWLCRTLKREEDNLKNSGEFDILTTSGANIAMKKSLKQIGVKDWDEFSVHNVRKTSETWALALHVDSLVLSKRFGHNLITAYQHYAQSDAYTFEEKDEIRQIFGDTFEN